MPRRPQSDDNRLPPQLRAAIEQMSPDEIRELLPRLLSMGAAAISTAEQSAPAPSRRRQPRPGVVTYRVRVDLDDARPPIWRRLELASDLTLDVLHRVLQTAMGWTDSHLHGFSSGAARFDRGAERYLTDFDVSEGEQGVLERDVRLDEVLQQVGDRLYYVYDFGDDWSHTLRLEAVEPRTTDAPAAVCTTGRRACPPEDVGGIHTYNNLVAALERGSGDVAAASPYDRGDLEELLAWLPPDFDPADFPLDEINQHLPATLVGQGGTGIIHLPPRVDAMLTRIGPSAREMLQGLVVEALGGDQPSVSAEETAAAVEAYAWLLRRIGPEGVKLTGAGHLPPAVVEDTVRELDLGREWIGTGNREHLTIPVLELRESAQRLGLLRKHSGRLSVTARGGAVLDDPPALWRHIAERLPLGRNDCERDAGTVLLLVAAAGESTGPQLDNLLATVLTSLGWRVQGSPSVPPPIAFEQARSTWEVLHRMKAFVEDPMTPRSTRPTPAGQALARAALMNSAS